MKQPGRLRTDMQMKPESELVLEFCVELSRRMIVSGANLERVQLAVDRICHAYGLSDVSLFLLSGNISLSAVDSEGLYASRQCTIPPAGIHLERLKKLNRLSYTVVSEKPEPQRLYRLLNEATQVREYPDWAVLLGQVAALSCLCLIFGGGIREILPVVVVTAVLHYVMILMARPGLDRVVTNAATMWLATVAAILVMQTGISTNAPVILITVSMLVIPGIPLVNAVRNLLCGNEMNGILQLAKVLIETLALAMGIYLALWMFGLKEGMSRAVVTTLSDPILLVIISFIASASFGVVFRIPLHDLWRAGLGGVLTRVALLLLAPRVPERLVYVSIAALIAALYAELLATLRKDPSTYFVYPSIVPLIPGDLFYYSLVGVYLGDVQMATANAQNCLLTLLGMSIGFVLSSIIAHYIRKMRHFKLTKHRKQGKPSWHWYI